MSDDNPKRSTPYWKTPIEKSEEKTVTLRQHVINVIKGGNREKLEKLKSVWGSNKLKKIWDEYKEGEKKNE